MASSQTLINVLHRLRLVEENQVRSMTMLNKLRSEMEDLSSRLQELELSRESSLREMNHLLQRFGEQVAISRKKEQEKARLAILHLREEMEQERSACRLLKVQNKKLTKELTEANIAATDACEELDKERKARELLEDVCNELAREIGEDKAEVEQLKQEQEKSRERLEGELKTLKMAMALRWGERTRSKLSEADRFELEGEHLCELSHKFEAFTSTAIEGRKEEVHSQVQQTKAVSGDLGLLQLEDCRGGQGETEKVGSLAELSHNRACSNAAENAFGSPHDDPLSGPHKRAPSGGMKHNVLIEEAQRPRKARRRPCMSGHHRRSNMPVRPQDMAFDMTKSNFWKAPHVNLAWHSSDDDNNSNREQAMVALPGYLPHHLEMGHVIEGAHRRLHDDNLLLICDARRENQVFSASCPPSSETTSHCEQSFSDVKVEGIHKRRSSARFDDVGCVAKLDLKSDTDMGRGTHHSFSEDDTPGYPASSSRGKRRGKQEALDGVRIHDGMKRLGMQNDRHSHEQHGDLQCEVGRGVETSDVDDFYFEPVRRLSDGHGNTSSLIDDDGDKDNMAGKRSCCSVIGEQVCCNIGSKDSPNNDNTESMRFTLVARQGALSNQQVESSSKVEVHNSLNTSPWRSGSTKPLQCFWPPSPEAFGGAKTHRKAASSSCTPTNTDHHDQPIKGRSWSPATSRPYYDDAGGGHERQTSVSMKSNSLGAQLIKARELDTKEKPAKTGFRISPLRRVLSHG